MILLPTLTVLAFIDIVCVLLTAEAIDPDDETF